MLEGERRGRVRELTSILLKMFDKCLATVFSLGTSSAAICALLRPVAASRSTSTSRSVSPPTRGRRLPLVLALSGPGRRAVSHGMSSTVQVRMARFRAVRVDGAR